MTDKTSALRALIEAVEAGSYERDLAACLPCPHSKGGTALLAFNGSLDAAQALHEALLPDHTRDVDATAPECGARVSIWSPRGPIVGVGDHQPSEARAWLLAILRAYLSQQDQA